MPNDPRCRRKNAAGLAFEESNTESFQRSSCGPSGRARKFDSNIDDSSDVHPGPSRNENTSGDDEDFSYDIEEAKPAGRQRKRSLETASDGAGSDGAWDSRTAKLRICQHGYHRPGICGCEEVFFPRCILSSSVNSTPNPR